MSVSAVGSTAGSPAVYSVQQPEQVEAKTSGGRDVRNDHDGDDGTPAPAASSNASGQPIGTTISRRG